jgi:hypothetical protein
MKEVIFMTENEQEKKLPKNVINWLITINLNPLRNPYNKKKN